jgi:hypothetical protein
MAQRLENEKNQETRLAAMQEQPNGVASGLEDAAAVDTVSISNRVTIGNRPRRSRRIAGIISSYRNKHLCL